MSADDRLAAHAKARAEAHGWDWDDLNSVNQAKVQDVMAAAALADDPMVDAERAEIDRLREEVADLQAEVERVHSERSAALTATAADLSRSTAQCREAEAALRRVQALHVKTEHRHWKPWCEADGRPWPCPTVAALAAPVADTPAPKNAPEGSQARTTPSTPAPDGDQDRVDAPSDPRGSQTPDLLANLQRSLDAARGVREGRAAAAPVAHTPDSACPTCGKAREDNRAWVRHAEGFGFCPESFHFRAVAATPEEES